MTLIVIRSFGASPISGVLRVVERRRSSRKPAGLLSKLGTSGVVRVRVVWHGNCLGPARARVPGEGRRGRCVRRRPQARRWPVRRRRRARRPPTGEVAPARGVAAVRHRRRLASARRSGDGARAAGDCRHLERAWRQSVRVETTLGHARWRREPRFCRRIRAQGTSTGPEAGMSKTEVRNGRKQGQEWARLQAARNNGTAWRKWGPYLSERQWGTVREDYSVDGNAWDYFTPRSGALARLSLGRGRTGRHLRRCAAALFRARAVERPRSDSQGASLRPDQRRGQPRRRRQGVLLLPRLHADALLHEVALQVPAARLSLCEAGRDEPEAIAPRARVRAARHRRLRRQPATSTSRSSTRRRRPRTSSSGSRRPTAAPRRRRCTCCRRSGSGTPGAGRRPTRSPRCGRFPARAAHA